MAENDFGEKLLQSKKGNKLAALKTKALMEILLSACQRN